MRGMCDNHGERLQAELLGGGAPHQDQRRRPVGDRARVCRGHRAVLAERGLERWDLLEVGLERRFILLHETLVFAGLEGRIYVYGSGFPRESSALAGGLR